MHYVLIWSINGEPEKLDGEGALVPGPHCTPGGWCCGSGCHTGMPGPGRTLYAAKLGYVTPSPHLLLTHSKVMLDKC